MERAARATEPDWQTVLGVRELFAALLKARRAIILYPDGHAFRETGAREFVACAHKVLRHGTVAVRVAADGFWFGGERVYADLAEDALCTDLGAAGVDGLELDPAADDAALRALVQLCAEAASDGSEPPCRQRLRDGAQLGAGVRLHRS